MSIKLSCLDACGLGAISLLPKTYGTRWIATTGMCDICVFLENRMAINQKAIMLCYFPKYLVMFTLQKVVK